MSSISAHQPICPYLGTSAETGSVQARPWVGHKCFAGGEAEEVSFRRQTASCLTAGHARCSRYQQQSVEEESEEQGRGRSFGRLDSTLSEGALVLVMAGMIVFALFAIAPRPSPAALGKDTTPAPTPAITAGDSEAPGSSPGAVPVATATAIPAILTPTASPARTPVPTPAPSKPRSYVVKTGDTLYSIARAHGVPVDALSKANGLAEPRLLKVGQTLKIP